MNERANPPKNVVTQALEILGHRLPKSNHARFVAYLSLIFAHAVEMEAARCQDSDDPVQNPAPPLPTAKRRPPKGLPAKLMVRLRRVHKSYDEMRNHGVRSGDIRKFLEALFADRQLFWIVNLAVAESSRQHLVLFWKNDHQQNLFAALGPAFDLSERQLKSATRRGATDPAFEQMTRGLAALYLEFTGELPGRSTDGMNEGREQGSFLALCRLMAEAVNNALPPDCQRKTPPDMDKTVRRLVKELKGERTSAKS